ncbi:MAG: ATP-binding protein [Candidatus Saccharibacteria bacterium]
MIKLRISTKILIYFLIVSLVPLLVTSYLLVSSANNQFLQTASAKQQAVANYLSDKAGSYLTNNASNLTYLSKIYSATNINSVAVDQNIAVQFSQNPDLQNLSIVNNTGKEQVVFNRGGKVTALNNVSSSDAFKAINFLNGKNYVSSVIYDDKNDPEITIAVPILVSNYTQHLNNLPVAEFGTYQSPNDITGAVIATYNIKNLWQTVLSTKTGQGGYAYIVDGLGNLVAHRDSSFAKTHQKLSSVQATKQFIDGNFSTLQTKSETGQQVVSTPKIIPNSGWAVIVEEPVSSIYSGINSYIRLATVVGISAVALAILISFFFRRQLTEPIKKLARGARIFGSGKFDHKIEIQSKDELQDLADTFNKMGFSINKLVTELKTNNTSLNTEKTKLNNIISSVTDGIIAMDINGVILSINPPAAKLANQPIDFLIGKSIGDVFSWEKDGKVLSLELNKPGTYQFSEVMLHHQDAIAYLDLVVSVIERKNSNVASIVTIHDLTKSRELDFMKLDFVAIAAHELRTPLTVVRGYLDLLNVEAKSQLSIFNIENLQKAILGSDQLRDLINKLLNIARIERGEMEIFTEKINISKLVSENVHQHESTAMQNEQKLSFVSNFDKTVYVAADPSSITEVLNNLLGNAIKFTPVKGEIKVNLKVDNNMARIEISDNGPGIPTEARDKLFTKFYRAERSLISNTRGTGLGLFISRQIIELQTGKIGLMPATGKGTTFYFTLPIYNPELHDKLISKHKQAGGIHGWFKKNTTS